MNRFEYCYDSQLYPEQQRLVEITEKLAGHQRGAAVGLENIIAGFN